MKKTIAIFALLIAGAAQAGNPYGIENNPFTWENNRYNPNGNYRSNTTIGNVGGNSVYLRSQGFGNNTTTYGNIGGQSVWMQSNGNTTYGSIGGQSIYFQNN